MKATIDSSVLLALGKLGYLPFLKEVFDKVYVPQSVFEEVSKDEAVTQIHVLSDEGFVEVVKCSNTELLNLLSSSLGKGEIETMTLALEFKTDMALLDDLKARKTAGRLKIKVMGTIALLKAFLDLRLIKQSPEDLVQQLVDQGFWIEEKVCLKILKG